MIRDFLLKVVIQSLLSYNPKSHFKIQIHSSLPFSFSLRCWIWICFVFALRSP
ncbi:hypothetical protein Hdeb2414_s0064g00765951 [Helianthus debilis subsp. tardiflorus]